MNEENLDERMIGIANNYFLARRILNSSLSLTDENFNILCAYINNVKKAFSSLQMEEQTFINNEYFYEAAPLWWQKTLSFNSYRKIKRQSINHFLEAFRVGY